MYAAFSYSYLEKNHLAASYCAYLSLPGALLAVLSPEIAFTTGNILLPRNLGYYGTHCLILVLAVSLITLGYFKPSWKDTYRVPILAICHLGLAHGLNILLRATVCPFSNYLFTCSPDAKVLEILWSFIPVQFVYLLPLIPLLIAWCVIFVIIYSAAYKKIRQKAYGDNISISE